MQIGKLTFLHGLFLAPMAGVTDKSFRALCRDHGAEAVFAEMVSSRALLYGDTKTHLLAETSESEHPVFLQLFGNEPETMAKGALALLRYQPDGIDINMGCPAHKISGNGDGSALMKNPTLAHDIVKATVEAMKPYNIPVSVKMRAGYDCLHINAPEVAAACEDAGASMITVHGRTKEQMYAPPVNLDVIRDVKRTVHIPVVGNGDIIDGESAAYMKDYTGCDALMIGRGALGNPYVFERIAAFFDGKPYTEPTNDELFHDIMRHISELCKLKGERVGAKESRKHIAWYLKGMRGAAQYRDEVNRAETLDEVHDIVRRALGMIG